MKNACSTLQWLILAERGTSQKAVVLTKMFHPINSTQKQSSKTQPNVTHCFISFSLSNLSKTVPIYTQLPTSRSSTTVFQL